MRIAFVSANREQLPDPVVPVGILSVMANTPADHERAFWDLCFLADPLSEIKRKISEFAPDLVAVGLRNLQNSHYTDTQNNLSYYDQLIRALRESTRAPVVVGGGGFSVTPDELMLRLKPEFGVVGEGEHSFPALVDILEAGRTSFEQVSNLCYFENGTLKRSPAAAPSININQLPLPPRVNLDTQYFSGGIESVQTKRGCALHCDYCTYPTIEGRNYRLKEPGLAVDEMERLQRSNPAVSHFFIVDSVFTIPNSHAKAVCREMIRRGFKTPWTCYANPLGFDEELAELMSAAGCAGMEVGSDSGTDRVLKVLRKGFDTARIRRMHGFCEQKGLKDCHTFILGTPGESMEEVRETLRFIANLNPYAAILMVWKDDAVIFDDKANEEHQNFRKTALEEVQKQAGLFPFWVVPELGINFHPPFFRRLRKRGFHGPLWQYIRNREPVGIL